jgi:hypothetical protein
MIAHRAKSYSPFWEEIVSHVLFTNPNSERPTQNTLNNVNGLNSCRLNITVLRNENRVPLRCFHRVYVLFSGLHLRSVVPNANPPRRPPVLTLDVSAVTVNWVDVDCYSDICKQHVLCKRGYVVLPLITEIAVARWRRTRLRRMTFVYQLLQHLDHNPYNFYSRWVSCEA